MLSENTESPRSGVAAHYHAVAVRDRFAFVHRLMFELAGDSRMSVEGDLSHCRWDSALNGSDSETAVLKRQTTLPVQDFFALPLTPAAIDLILKQLKSAGLKQKIRHLQIERSGMLELGAYDNFHPECVVTGPGISTALLDELQTGEVIWKYAARPSREQHLDAL